MDRPLEPEEELDFELEYHQRKKRKKPDRFYIRLWEAYSLLKYHVRNFQGYDQQDMHDL